MGIEREIGRFFAGLVDNSVQIEKNLERSIITMVFSPLKLLQREGIKQTKIKDMTQEAKKTQTALKNIAGELDSSMKGEFSKKVIETLEKKSTEYDLIK